MVLTKNHLENRYNFLRRSKMEKLGKGVYDENDKKYWARMNKFYKQNSSNIKKSKNVIEVNFKTKKIIKGTTNAVKEIINKAA
jgi:hypothetical protein